MEHDLPKNRLLRGIYLMFWRYNSHNVAIQGAALAFYLLFTIFPMLIFFSALLGLMNLDLAAIIGNVSELLPSSVVELLEMYLAYVNRESSVRLLVFGLVFSIWFPMRAANTLMRAVRTAYHLGPPRGALQHIVKTFLYTIFLIVTIIATIALILVGEMALDYATAHFALPAQAAQLWQELRFPVMALLMYFALYFLYAAAQDQHRPVRDIFPGVLASLLGWLVASWLFSYYVENLAGYSLFYGSIGAVIILLMWLYLSATVLIMGAELNGTLISLRRDRLAE